MYSALSLTFVGKGRSKQGKMPAFPGLCAWVGGYSFFSNLPDVLRCRLPRRLAFTS